MRLHIFRERMLALVYGWQIRRVIRILEDKIQSYVNEENPKKRVRIKQEFHILFDKISHGKLYLVSRYRRFLENKKHELNMDLTYD